MKPYMKISKLVLLFVLTGVVPILAAPEGAWEHFTDGSIGRTAQFRVSGGVMIAAYVRKPKGPGPFPIVVNQVGGNGGVQKTYGFGRSTSGLVEEFVNEGWAVYSMDYRPGGGRTLNPIQYSDAVAGIEAARQLPFVDADRLAVMGGSHGAHVMSRVASMVNARCGVLYSPTLLDMGQMRRALKEEKDPVVLTRLKLIMSFVRDPAGLERTSALAEAPHVRFPLLIINGGTDISLPQWMVLEYVAKLRAAGKPVETYLPPIGPHGFFGGNTPEGKEARERTLAFLKKYLAPPAATR
jgi:dipeptidyl aminopeptidase/acylaminoacyl peptidase